MSLRGYTIVFEICDVSMTSVLDMFTSSVGTEAAAREFRSSSLGFSASRREEATGSGRESLSPGTTWALVFNA
jgi:hypothetical protein